MLKQAAEQTRARFFLARYLRLTVAFAVTNRHGWCVNRRRYFAGKDVRVNISFWLFPMPQSPACGWLSLGELKRVEKDGWILCHAL